MKPGMKHFFYMILGLSVSFTAMAKIENPLAGTDIKFSDPIKLKFDSYLRYPSNTKGRERFTINYAATKNINGSSCEIGHEYQLTDKDENYAALEQKTIEAIKKKSSKEISPDNFWRAEYSRFTMDGFYINLVRTSPTGNAKKLTVKCTKSSPHLEINSKAAIAQGHALLKQLGISLPQNMSAEHVSEPAPNQEQRSNMLGSPAKSILIQSNI